MMRPLTALKIALTALLLYLFLQRTELRGVVAALDQLSAGLILVLALLNILGVFISAYKWRMLLPEANFHAVTVACFASYYFALLLPGQVAQEAAKAYFLASGKSPKLHRIAASVVVDKIVSVLGLLIVGGIGLAFTQKQLPSALAWLFAAFGLLALTALFGMRVAWVHSRAKRALARLGALAPRFREVAAGMARVLDAWHEYSRDLWLLAGNLVVAIVYQFIGVIMFDLLSRQLQLPIGFFDWSWIVGALTLALFLPITIGGLGVREGTLIGLLGLFGCGSDVAIALSLTAFSFVIMLAVIGGLLALAIKPREAVK